MEAEFVFCLVAGQGTTLAIDVHVYVLGQALDVFVPFAGGVTVADYPHNTTVTGCQRVRQLMWFASFGESGDVILQDDVGVSAIGHGDVETSGKLGSPDASPVRWLHCPVNINLIRRSHTWHWISSADIKQDGVGLSQSGFVLH